MVDRGTRWQRYCWFCKEFWAHRVEASGLEPQHSKVPDEPSQGAFLDRWFDYHRGYKVICTRDDGTEEREIAACQRPWRDVAPGYLPTFDQPDVPLARALDSATSHAEVVSIDETLDSLINADEEDDEDIARVTQLNLNERPHREIPEAPFGSAYALQQLQRTRARNLPPSNNQIQAARSRLVAAETRRRQIAIDLANADRDLVECRRRQTQLMQAQQTARNLERVFGTREELQRQGASYISPLTSMFTRAYDRYRTAEEVRAAERTTNANETRHRQFLGATNDPTDLQNFIREVEVEAIEDVSARRRPQSLDDARIERPPPKTEEEMQVELKCKICLQQIADTAVLPCGHLVMCGYCAAIAMPTKDEAQTQPLRRSAACPLCKKTVKRVARIYTA